MRSARSLFAKALPLGLLFAASSSANALTVARATAPTDLAACPSDISMYAPYDPRCSTFAVYGANGQQVWVPDVTLGPTAGGAQMTMAASLAGAIASLKTADGTELVHSAGHGAAFTMVLWPDDPVLDAAFPENQAWQNKSGCDNPTEEGSGFDAYVDWSGTTLMDTLGLQQHGMSSTYVNQWNAGTRSDAAGVRYDYFESDTRWANWWDTTLGYDAADKCTPSLSVQRQSNFSTYKTVRLGRLQDANGVSLAHGFSSYVVVDRTTRIDPAEVAHAFIGSQEVVYLARSGPAESDNQFQNFCVMNGSAEGELWCPPTSPVTAAAISNDHTEPVITADASWSHALGSLSELPDFVVPPPAANGSIVFGNQLVQFNTDPWQNTIMEQNINLQNIGPRADGKWVSFHTRTYYAVGTQFEVATALSAIRARMRANVAIEFAGW